MICSICSHICFREKIKELRLFRFLFLLGRDSLEKSLCRSFETKREMKTNREVKNMGKCKLALTINAIITMCCEY